MKYSALKHSIILALIALAIGACSSSKPIGEWRSDTFSGTLDNYLVIGVTSQSARRRVFEDTFVGELAALQVTATPSYKLLASSLELDREIVEKAIEGKNIGAVLITRLAGFSEKEVYQAADDRDEELSYFSISRDGVKQIDDGYYEQHMVLTLETKVYDTASEALVWSMQSEIEDPAVSRQAIQDQIKLTIDTLRKRGLVRN
jgi:hypothetical protein